MTVQPDFRRGWCPGALRPMVSGDGWLVRVRPRVGAFTLDQIEALADLARSCGNGEIDLTNRANLQLRGLSPATIEPAQARLDAVGLIDADAAAEAVRNVIVAPLAGLDPDAVDVRPIARALEAALIADARLFSLPGKFGFALDGGGACPLRPGLADITLSVSHQSVRLTLDGAAAQSAVVAPEQAVAAALALAQGFAEAARNTPAIRRMRDAVAGDGADRLFSQAGLTSRPATAVRAPEAALPIGVVGPAPAPWAVGLGLPFGRIHAATLRALARLARCHGADDVRPATGRILVMAADIATAGLLLADAARLGLITTALDPRLGMDVCPGAPGCQRGSTATRADAEAIATLLAQRGTRAGALHVSGCVKGCARRAAASITLVACEGRYDLIRNGTASAVPNLTSLSSEELPGAVCAAAGDQHD